MPLHYIYLIVAVVAETIGTTALPATQQFTRFWPSAIVVVGYGLAFYFLTLVLKFMQVGVVYALWSGLGIVLITLMGWLIYDQRINLATALGMGLIVAGIAVIHLFGEASTQ